MPTYEYHCTKCDHRWSVVATIAEHEQARAPACPKCGQKAAELVFSPFFAKTVKKS